MDRREEARCWDSKAGGVPISLGPCPPRATWTTKDTGNGPEGCVRVRISISFSLSTPKSWKWPGWLGGRKVGEDPRNRTHIPLMYGLISWQEPYGCESWRTTQTMQQKIQTFFNTRLRRIYKFQWPEKIRNEDMWERAGQEPVAKQILRRKWGWIGHTLRKPASSTTRQALTWNPQEKRKTGRPRNSWRRDTEAELKQQRTNWSGMTRAAQNRVRWRGVVDGLCFTGSEGHK